LSKASLETLAIVAYKQPIIRSDIEHIRGVDCGGVLRMLLERKLVRVLGRKEIPGRPLIYATTKFFLELFDLRDLKDLPTLKEIEALGDTSTNENTAPPLATDDDNAQPPSTEQTPDEESKAPETGNNTTPEP
jgi:segregation and condensation protein B